MSTPDTEAARSAPGREPIGKAALIASVGGMRSYADWTNPDHRLRRLLAEFIGMAGLTFILSRCGADTETSMSIGWALAWVAVRNGDQHGLTG